MAIVTHYVFFRVAVVYRRLKYLYLLAGELRPFQSADQLFCLAGEHRTADDFYPSGVMRLAC